MKRLFDGQSQHFHKSRQDRMLLPHRELSGLLFTINPRQEERARREIVQFLEPIVAEIKREYSLVDVESKNGLCSSSEEKMEKTEKDDIDNEDNKSTYELSADVHLDHSDNNEQNKLTSSAYKSTSSLLALELNEVLSNNINNSGSKKEKSTTHISRTETCKRPRTHTIYDIQDDNNNNDSIDINNDYDNDSCAKYDLQEMNKTKRDERNVEECHESCQQYKQNGEWLHIRETNCKGYLFVQIPVINRQRSCVVCNNTINASSTSNKITLHETQTIKQSTCSISMLPIITNQFFSNSLESNQSCELVHCKENATTDSGDVCSCIDSSTNMDDKKTNFKKQNNLVAHSIVINPLVAITVERLFDNLLANPRPVFRSCFRLYPVELCCCPTLPEMQAALQTLLNMHFPPKISVLQNVTTERTNFTNANGVSMTTTEMSDNNNILTRMDSNNLVGTEQNKLTNEHALEPKTLLLPSLPSHRKYAHKSLHTVALHVNVKNNTKVEQQKSWLTSQLLQCIPANRFILVSPQYMSQKKISSPPPLLVEAVITVNILHSTCCIGVQNDFENRHKYNVHDIASESLQLQFESTFTSRVHAQPEQEI